MSDRPIPDGRGGVPARTAQAAEELDAFLRHHRRVVRTPGRPVPAPEEVAGTDHPVRPRPGDTNTADRAPAPVPAPLRLASPDWLHHDLHVAGPDKDLADFAAAARGTGTVPWVLDFAALEEDLAHRLVLARELSLAGSRILARQLREAVERRHGLAVARVGHGRACPLDLHSLVPVPPDVLALGPGHARSLLWLWAHWGTTEALRRVTVDAGDPKRGDPERRDPGRRGRGPGRAGLRFRFWSADWSPWRALQRMRLHWPGLRFDLQPRYDRE